MIVGGLEMNIGYMRPTNEDASCQKQLEMMEPICGRVYKEDHDSAKNRNVLSEVLNNISEGDKIVVEQLFILADSSRHLLEILDLLNQKGAYLQALHEEIDTEAKTEYPLSLMLQYLVEFQNEIIRERTKKGMEYAKKHGKTTGRPRKADENVKRAIEMYQSKKYSLKDIKEETGISKSTLYRYLEN